MKFQFVTAVSTLAALAAMTLPVKSDPLEDLEACRSIAAESERLACFEAGYDQLRAAGMTADSMLKSNVVEVRVPAPVSQLEGSEPAQGPVQGKVQTGGSRFGLHSLKKGEAEKADEFGLSRQSIERGSGGRIERLSATVVSAKVDALGRERVTLDNGQVWRTEKKVRAKAGDSAEIHRGFAGGYFLTAGRKRNIRATRIDDGSNTGQKSNTVVAPLAPTPDVETTKKKGFLSRLPRPFARKKTGAADNPAGSKPTSEGAGNQGSVSHKVASVMVDPLNMFILTLENGQVWQQVEGSLKIRNNDVIIIEESASGVYFLGLDGGDARVLVKKVG